jgi:hypothetical protein
MKSEEGLSISHEAEVPALNWLTGIVAIDKTISDSTNQRFKSSLGFRLHRRRSSHASLGSNS